MGELQLVTPRWGCLAVLALALRAPDASVRFLAGFNIAEKYVINHLRRFTLCVLSRVIPWLSANCLPYGGFPGRSYSLFLWRAFLCV